MTKEDFEILQLETQIVALETDLKNANVYIDRLKFMKTELVAKKRFLDSNIKYLKEDAVVFAMTEYRKIKDSLKKVNFELNSVVLDLKDLESAIQKQHMILTNLNAQVAYLKQINTNKGKILQFKRKQNV